MDLKKQFEKETGRSPYVYNEKGEITANFSYVDNYVKWLEQRLKVSPLETVVMQLEDKVEKLELRLLNSFQLIKNGKQLGYLKYEQFKKEMDIERNDKGEKVAQRDSV